MNIGNRLNFACHRANNGMNTGMTSSKNADQPHVDHLIQQINRLAEIGRALSGEQDLNLLLEKICDEVRNFTRADACTLYIVKDNQLHFEIVQNHTMNIRQGGKTGEVITLPPVDLVESNVSAYVALKRGVRQYSGRLRYRLVRFHRPEGIRRGHGIPLHVHAGVPHAQP